MFDPQKLLPVIKGSFPKANDAQLLEALTKLAQKHPNLDGGQALAAIQEFMKQKSSPTIGGMARKGAI